MQRISIIIPIYNVENYLNKCLQSISSQTYKNLEILLINDGSTDTSPKIAETFLKDEPRATLINQKNQGLSAARNTGTQKSTGTYLAFVDSDDWLEPTFIEDLHAAITKAKPSISVCGFTEVIAHKTHTITPKTHQTTGEKALTTLLTQQKDLDIITWNKLYHRDLFARHNIEFPKGKIHEDNLTTYKLYTYAHTVSYIEKPLYNYRKRPGSITDKSTADLAPTKEKAATEALKWLTDHNSQALPAAQIALLYAKLTYLDQMIKSNQIDPKIWQTQTHWIDQNRQTLLKNPHLTQKLKLYLTLLRHGHTPYKTLKKITIKK